MQHLSSKIPREQWKGLRRDRRLPNGFAQITPRGSTMVFDDEHIALWERGRKQRFRPALRCATSRLRAAPGRSFFEENVVAKIPQVLHEHINTAYPANVCLIGTMLDDQLQHRRYVANKQHTHVLRRS
jgi:hypothetical protein